jgi:pSer/pThr/pTyr-binding forkhead associated (FHA) protein
MEITEFVTGYELVGWSMNCSKCGVKNDHNAKICESCGAKLGKGADADTTMALSPVDVEKELQELNIAASEGPVLIVQKGPFVGQAFNLSKSDISLGRDPGSDIYLDDITVSRNHAVLNFHDGVVRISDADSLNGTYVNQQLVETPTMLASHDEIQIGKFKLIFIK